LEVKEKAEGLKADIRDVIKTMSKEIEVLSEPTEDKKSLQLELDKL